MSFAEINSWSDSFDEIQKPRVNKLLKTFIVKPVRNISQIKRSVLFRMDFMDRTVFPVCGVDKNRKVHFGKFPSYFSSQ